MHTAHLVALFAFAAACSSGGDDEADLVLFFTGTINGYVEPCGCVAGQIGGIDRIAGFLERELAARPDALFVETGDLVEEDTELGDSVARQLPAKAEAFVSTWAQLGCSAIAVGEMDLLHLGAETLAALGERHGIPILCGNVVDTDGKQVFPSYVIVERAGRRIGIFSLLAPELEQAKVKEAQKIDVARELRRRGLRLQDWSERAQQIIDELVPQTDMILCASHLGFDLNQKLARRFPQIDLVFGGHFGKAEAATTVVARTPVLVSVVRGAHVDRVEWWWPEESDYFLSGDERRERGHGTLANVSEHRDAEQLVELQVYEYEGMQRRELAHDAEEFPVLLRDKLSLLELARQNVALLPPLPEGNRFAHVQVAMHRDIPRSDRALSAVDDYHATVHALWEENASAEGERNSPIFVGPERCEECHPAQVEFWRATRHSFALAALEATRQEVDAECFPCHTVGWGMRGGFLRPGNHEAFAHVQCAACHGPTGAHVLGGASYLDPSFLMPIQVDTCKKCHNEEHDPHFDERVYERLSRAACPKMEDPADRTLAMREATARAADLLANSEDPPWTVIVTAYRKAALPDHALAAASAWCGQRPKSPEARTALGELLIEAGRHAEAVGHLEFATERDAANPRGWASLALALMDTDPARAESAAREALSLAPDNPLLSRLVVELLVKQNRVGAATDFAMTQLATQPHLRPLFEDLVELPQVESPSELSQELPAEQSP